MKKLSYLSSGSDFQEQNLPEHYPEKDLIISLTFLTFTMNQYYNALIHTDFVVPEVLKKQKLSMKMLLNLKKKIHI